jgi:hypothetical protein
VKSGFFFASKRNEIFASISNFASEAKVRAHPIVGRQIDTVYCNRWYLRIVLLLRNTVLCVI